MQEYDEQAPLAGPSAAPSVKAICSELIGLCHESMRSRDRWHRLDLTHQAINLTGRLRSALMESRNRQIVALAREEVPQKKIARTAGVTPSYVSRTAKEAGIPPRVYRDTDEPQPAAAHH